MPGPGQVRHRGGMGKEQLAAPGRAGTMLVAGVLGSGVIGLYGGITALVYTGAQLASPHNEVTLPGGLAAAGRTVAMAGVPAGITALALGINVANWIRARRRTERRTGFAEATAGWLSGSVGLVAYVAAGGLQVLAALYYDG